MAERDYTILTQRQDRALNAARELVDVLEISWEGPNGITGTVVIPANQLTPENVDMQIRAQLATRLQIAGLGTRGE